jgi:hypothetical protein
VRWWEILALVLHHDEQAVLTAVELALEAGVASKTHVLNVLHRLLDAKPIAPAPVTAPQALRLANEPKADVLRYDTLRGRASAPPVGLASGRRARRYVMRHDPASGAIVIMLRELKMHGMAQAVAELAEQGSPAFEAAQPMLSQLLKAETAEREVRSVAYQLKLARFQPTVTSPASTSPTARSTRRWCASSIGASSWTMRRTWCSWAGGYGQDPHCHGAGRAGHRAPSP